MASPLSALHMKASDSCKIQVLNEDGIGSLGFVHFYDNFNGILDPLTLKFYGSWQVLKRKRMGVDDGCVKLALGHQGHGAVGGTASLAANTENVNIIANQMGHIYRDRFKRKGCQTNTPSPVDHFCSFV